MNDYREQSGIEKFIFLGTAFKKDGRDLEALQVEGLTALAFNPDQSEVPGEVITAGSGAAAAYEWLCYLADKINISQ